MPTWIMISEGRWMAGSLSCRDTYQTPYYKENEWSSSVWMDRKVSGLTPISEIPRDLPVAKVIDTFPDWLVVVSKYVRTRFMAGICVDTNKLKITAQRRDIAPKNRRFLDMLLEGMDCLRQCKEKGEPLNTAAWQLPNLGSSIYWCFFTFFSDP